MSARDAILSAIRAAAVPVAPPASLPAARPPRAEGDGMHDAFFRVLEEVGGHGVIRRGDQTVAQLVADWLGDDRANTLVIRGRFAVAENGAVYVDAGDLAAARNSIVLAEHLVVVVPLEAIVPTMHEALRLMPADVQCGWFLSGPSKTADIEQSLVFGAQGSRTHHVIFEPA